jgi:hypothetical protein
MSKVWLVVVLSLAVFAPGVEPTLAKPGKYVAFQGTWLAHVGALKVYGDGDGWLNYRMYRWCSQSPPPCDKVVAGGRFYDGGFLAFRLTSLRGAWATGMVFYSTFLDQTGTGLRLHLRSDGGIEVPSSLIEPRRSYPTAFLVFCKPTHWLPQCGA